MKINLIAKDGWYPREQGSSNENNPTALGSFLCFALEIAKRTTPLSRIIAKSMKNPALGNNFCKLIITDDGFYDDSPWAYWRALSKTVETLRSTGKI